MAWLAGLVVEVLVNRVVPPKHTALALKPAVGFGDTSTLVEAETEWVPTVVVQV